MVAYSHVANQWIKLLKYTVDGLKEMVMYDDEGDELFTQIWIQSDLNKIWGH